ncbi:MAG: hypothetical protein FK733_17585 [Asgard group archaeon]|nr:hypothetical protein [Asgard group archaeon]
MNKRRTFVILIITILIVQFSILHTTQSNAISSNLILENTGIENKPSLTIITPDTPTGMEVIKSNVVRNGELEEAAGNGAPANFYSYGTGYSICNFTYQDEVYAGTYGSQIIAQGTKLNTGYGAGNRGVGSSSNTAVSEDLEIDLWFNPKASPDYGTNARMFVTLSFTRDYVDYYYMQYYLSRQTFTFTNQSNQVYYDLRESTLDTWYHLTRNVTDDFVKGMTPLTPLSSINLYHFRVYVESPTDATGDTILLMDEVSITNGTSYDYFAINGDFEAGDGSFWYASDFGPGNCELTQADKTQGNSAMNLTAYAPTIDQSSYQEVYTSLNLGWDTVPKGYVALQPGDAVFEFDWKYSDSGTGLGSQMAYWYISARNETDSTTLYYYLGTEDDLISQSNDSIAPTTRYRFAAPGMGTRDVWNHISLDMYNIFEYLNLKNFILNEIGFYVDVSSSDNTILQLLVDDFKLISYPTGDPGFEFDIGFDPSDPIRLWNTNAGINFANITTEAHTGQYAANLSSYGGLGTYHFNRHTYFPVTNNLFTDFWWRLDKLSSGGGAYANIRLILDTTYSIYYIVGSRNLNFVNDSGICYYIVDNHNQTGTWYNLFRNVTHDANSYFGIDNWNITYVSMNAYSDGSSEVVAIFDDINFVTDVTGPTLTNLVQVPSSAEYFEDVTVYVEAYDNIGLDSVELNYAIGSGPPSWASVQMTFNGAEFEATIPVQAYDTYVRYYIEAEDIYGHETTLGTDVSPYSYTVEDNIDPELLVEHPSELEDLGGLALFNITANDPGSGIATFEITIDGFTVYDEATAPLTYEWNTTDYSNAQHTIVFTVTDNTANEYWIGYVYTIFNEINVSPTPTTTEEGSLFGGLIGFGIIALTSSIVIYFSERRKKYLK